MNRIIDRTRPIERRSLRGFTAAGRTTLALATAIVLVNGCGVLPTAASVEPGVDFVAHRGMSGIVVDRMKDGQTAVLVPADSASSGGPTYLLRSNGKIIAALWVIGRDHVIVRQTADPDGPVTGQVWASWKGDAMRLRLEPAGGIWEHTGSFYRRNVDSEEPAALGKNMLSVHDLPGVYRANLRDAQNANVGWLRVDVGQYMAASHSYDGILPTSLDGPLAVGAVALIEAQLGHVERHSVDTWWSN
jgi:hypothetical protein